MRGVWDDVRNCLGFRTRCFFQFLIPSLFYFLGFSYLNLKVLNFWDIGGTIGEDNELILETYQIE